MKTKFYFKWLFSFVLMLGLFATAAQAQLATDVVGRDSAALKIKHITRAQFILLSYQDQMNILDHPPFIVDDLINATAAEMMLNTPGLVYMTAYKFYSVISPADEQQALNRPQMYKIYGGH